MYVCLYVFHLSVFCLSVLFMCLSIMFVCLFVYSSVICIICLFVCFFVCLFYVVYHLFVCMSVYLYFQCVCTEKLSLRFVTETHNSGIPTAEEADAIRAAQAENRAFLRIPRRCKI